MGTWRSFLEISAGADIAPLASLHKTRSIFALLDAGLATPPGVVLFGWNPEAAAFVHHYAEERRWTHFLVRTDNTKETGHYPRGGFLIPVAEAEKVTREILSGGRVVILLLPLNKYANNYSLNLRYHPGEPIALLEIMGPGFDVSDLNRGDLSPHETIRLRVSDETIGPTVLDRIVATPTAYTDSVRLRLAKVGKEQAARFSSFLLHQEPVDEFAEKGRHYLAATGEDLLLKNAASYPSIPQPILASYLGQIQDLPWKLAPLVGSEEWVVSCSCVMNRGSSSFWFWDVVIPSRKYRVTK